MGVVEFFRGQSLTVENGSTVTVCSPVYPMGAANWVDLTLNVLKLKKTGGSVALHYAIQTSITGGDEEWIDAPTLGGTVSLPGPVQKTASAPAILARGWAKLQLANGLATDIAFATFDMIANITRSAG